MPTSPKAQALFIRWLWLVYLPLGLLVLALPLMYFRVLTGGTVWLVGLLAAYCVVPMRLLLETKRKGLELPRRPKGRRSVRPPAPARATSAAAKRGRSASTARVAPPPLPPRIKRRRAVVGVLGIGIMLLLGGLLFILGMGRAGSGTFGLALIGLGGFLMLLSVTLPTFKIVDVVVRAIGRVASRKGGSSNPRTAARPTNRS